MIPISKNVFIDPASVGVLKYVETELDGKRLFCVVDGVDYAVDPSLEEQIYKQILNLRTGNNFYVS